MEYFFEKKDRLLLKMITHLIEANKKKIALATLSKQIGIDKRSIISLVYQYNYLNFSQSGLQLTIENDTLFYQRAHDFSYNHLTCLLFQNNLLFKLCRSFLLRTFTTLNHFSSENFISTSSMYRRIKQLKLILAEYNLSLNLSDKHYILGEEKQIRHFYFELYSHAYGLESSYLNHSQMDELAITKHTNNYLTKLPFHLLQKIKLASYISLSRIKRGFYLPSTLFLSDPYEQIAISSDVKSYSTAVLKSYTNSQESLIVESTFLAVYSITFDVIVEPQEQLPTLLTMDHSLPYPTLARNWIKQFMTYFNSQLTVEKTLFLYENLHYYFFICDLFDHSFAINLESQKNKSRLKHDNPYVYKKTSNFIQHLAIKDNFPQTQYLNALYYGLIKDVLFLEHTITLFVFSSSTALQKKAIQQMITNLSPVQLTFSDNLNDDIDIVISDYSAKQLKQFSKQNIRTVVTNTFPTKKNYDTIVKAIYLAHETKLEKKSKK